MRPKNSSYLSSERRAHSAAIGRHFWRSSRTIEMATGVVNSAPKESPLGATGINFAEFNAMSGGFKFIDGGPFQRPDDVIIDDFYADQKKKKVGDTIKILNVRLARLRHHPGGKLAHIVMPIETLQDKTGNKGKISQIYLKVDDPARTSTPSFRSLKKLEGFEDYPIYSMEEFTSLLSIGNVPGLQPFILVIMGIGVVIGFAVVCLSMYMAVLQRTREIGILKSLGGSKSLHPPASFSPRPCCSASAAPSSESS